jgi:succinyl-CoA synthetase alpha subunit
VSILIDKSTRVVVQGITGRDGAFHTEQMIKYGTRVVAGVTPGKGGETIHGVPVFDSVLEAVAATKANTSVIYVPAAFAVDAIHEAADAEVGLIVCITEGLPVRDTLGAWHRINDARGPNALGKPRLIGPNCPGLISPGQSKVGILPGHICTPGSIGVVSRSGTLTYEVVLQLTRAGLGQSTCLGIGGDPVIGTNFIDAVTLFEADPQTEAIVLIGEIGGTDEEEAAQFIRRHVRKPVVAFVAGQTAPPGKRMGHAGAIISGGSGTAAEKMAAFEAAGISVARIPSEIPGLIKQALSRRRKNGARPAAKPGAPKRATAKRGAPKRATAKRGAPKRATAKRGAPKRATAKRGAPKRATRPARKPARASRPAAGPKRKGTAARSR